MLAVVIDEGSLSWSDQPDPVPGSADVLVRVHAAGLNGADLMQRAGRYPPPAGIPAAIPGLECAGTVEDVGREVRRFSPGDRIMGLLGGAGQAELAVIHERVALPVPDTVPFEVAGGFCEAFSTAHDALFTQAQLQPGDRLLVTGAAGGVGVAAVQLGSTAGASVVASVRDPVNREKMAAFGAVAVGTDEVSDHGPYDIVLELVGAPNLATDLGALAPCGRIVVIGVGAGVEASIDLRQLMRLRGTIRASMLRGRALEEKATVARRVERHVVPLLASGRVVVPIAERFAFADVEQAYERFAAGAKLGKIVLVR